MANTGSEAARVVGRRVRTVREELGLTQEDLGELSGVHFTNVGKLERGEANPTLENLVGLAGALRVDLGDLVHGLASSQVPDRPPRLSAAQKLAEGTARQRARRG